MHYWWNYFLAVLPGLLWMLTCTLPALAGTYLAAKQLRRGNRPRAILFAVASIAAALSAILIVGSFLWSKPGSSTDAIVWVFAPILSAAILGIVITAGKKFTGNRELSPSGMQPSRISNAALIGAPLLLACVLASGIVRYSFRNGGMAFAERTSDPELLRDLYNRQGVGESGSGVQLFLADNRATPADVLDALSRSSFAHVRAHVALNGNISAATRERLAADPNPKVRSFAQKEQPATP